MVEALTSVHADACGFPIPFVPSVVFMIARKLFWNIKIATLFCIHHVAAIESLILNLESWVILLTIRAILLASLLSVLCVLCRSMLPRQGVDVRSEDLVECRTLLSLNVRALT